MNETLIRKGWVVKKLPPNLLRSQVFTNRYLVLTNNLIRYFHKQPQADNELVAPADVEIELEFVRGVYNLEENNMECTGFCIVTDDRELELRCYNSSDAQSWIKDINEAREVCVNRGDRENSAGRSRRKNLINKGVMSALSYAVETVKRRVNNGESSEFLNADQLMSLQRFLHKTVIHYFCKICIIRLESTITFDVDLTWHIALAVLESMSALSEDQKLERSKLVLLILYFYVVYSLTIS